MTDTIRDLAYNTDEKQLRKLALNVIEPKKLALMTVYNIAEEVLKHYKLLAMGDKAILVANKDYDKVKNFITVLDIKKEEEDEWT